MATKTQVLLLMIDFEEIIIYFFLFPDEIVPQLCEIADPFLFEDIIIAGKPPGNLIALGFWHEVKMFY